MRALFVLPLACAALAACSPPAPEPETAVTPPAAPAASTAPAGPVTDRTPDQNPALSVNPTPVTPQMAPASPPRPPANAGEKEANDTSMPAGPVNPPR